MTPSRWSSVALAALVVGGAHAQKSRKPVTKPTAKPPVKAKATPTPKPPVDSYKPLAVQTKLAPCWAVAFSPDGSRLVIGTFKKVLVFETASWTKAAEWAVSSDAVRTLAFSADGKKLAAGTGVPGASGSIVVLDATTGQVLQTLRAHKDTVEAVQFRGDTVLSASDDERVCLTEATTGRAVGALTEHNGRCLSVAVPTQSSAQTGGEIFATGGEDKMLKIWDAGMHRVVVNFDQCASPVWSLCALPQPGRFLAGSGDGNLRVFGVRADGRAPAPDQPMQRAGFVAQTMNGAHDGPIYSVAVTPDGRFYVSGGADKRVVLWNANGNRQKELTDATGEVWGVATDGRRIAAASLDGKVRIYDLPQATLVKELP